jgi:hypothetical protein
MEGSSWGPVVRLRGPYRKASRETAAAIEGGEVIRMNAGLKDREANK